MMRPMIYIFYPYITFIVLTIAVLYTQPVQLDQCYVKKQEFLKGTPYIITLLFIIC
jgi:hypothetical protein